VKSVLLVSWVQDNRDWLGYVVMAFFAGPVGHILDFEKSEVHLPAVNHALHIIFGWFKAFFVGGLIYTGMEASLHVPPPMCWFLTGVLGVFSSDTIRMFRTVGESLVRMKFPNS
jgi:hypothetical protein